VGLLNPILAAMSGGGRFLPNERCQLIVDKLIRARGRGESMVFCFEERSRNSTGETRVPRGMGVWHVRRDSFQNKRPRGRRKQRLRIGHCSEAGRRGLPGNAAKVGRATQFARLSQAARSGIPARRPVVRINCGAREISRPPRATGLPARRLIARRVNFGLSADPMSANS
jgi:hypothetical protein